MNGLPGSLDRDEGRRWEFLNFNHLFEKEALEPSREALVSPVGRRTYGEVRERIRRLAHGIAELGLERFDRVAVLLSNRLEFIEIEGGSRGRGERWSP